MKLLFSISIINHYYKKVKQKFSNEDNFIKNLFETNEKKNSGLLRLNQIMSKLLIISKCLQLPSWKILVPRTSRGRPPPMSQARPLKILSDHPVDVPSDVPIWRPGDVLKWCLRDVLIWRSRDVPGRLIRDVPRTFSGRPLEDLQSTQTRMSQKRF